MYQQTFQEYDTKLQEFLNKRKELNKASHNCRQIKTPHSRPYTLPVNNKRTSYEVFVPSERKPNESLHIKDKHKSFDQNRGRNISSMCHSAPINHHNLTPNKQTTSCSTYSYSPNIPMGQGEPRNHRQYYSTSYKNGSSHIQASTMKSSKEQQNQSRTESIIEWFDHTVEAELQKRHNGSADVSKNPTLDPELLDAIDKLAKAEAIMALERADAPPELAEEVAVAEAKDFQAELTGIVKQELPGLKPIEVVGYVGITRPRKPKKTNFNM